MSIIHLKQALFILLLCLKITAAVITASHNDSFVLSSPSPSPSVCSNTGHILVNAAGFPSSNRLKLHPRTANTTTSFLPTWPTSGSSATIPSFYINSSSETHETIFPSSRNDNLSLMSPSLTPNTLLLASPDFPTETPSPTDLTFVSETLSTDQSTYSAAYLNLSTTSISPLALSLGTSTGSAANLSWTLLTSPPSTSRSTSTNESLGITELPNPVPTIISPTDDELKLMASNLSLLIAPLFPLLKGWVNNPPDFGSLAITNELEKILPEALGLLGKLPEPPGVPEPCKKNARRLISDASNVGVIYKRSIISSLLKTVFSLVKCVTDNLNKIKDVIVAGADGVDTVKALMSDLEPQVEMLGNVTPDGDPPDTLSNQPTTTHSDQPTTTRSTSTSSSSCTPRTVSDCSVVCGVTATTIATTTVGGLTKRGNGQSCSTTCRPSVIKCYTTGVTTIPTLTSTTTTITTTTQIYDLCSPDCTECADDIYDKPTEVPKGYLTAPNGVLYKSAPIVQSLAVQARSPRQTEDFHHENISARAFTTYNDADWGGDSKQWFLDTFGMTPRENELKHSRNAACYTSGITSALKDRPATWALQGLYGCTSVIVMSRKRIHMTHIWETPSMNKDDDTFIEQVWNVLEGGNAACPGLKALAGAGGDFENTDENHVRAFIVTPNPNDPPYGDPNPHDPKYPNRVLQLNNALKGIIGRSAESPIIPYIISKQLAQSNTGVWAEGKVMIRYDPAVEYGILVGQDEYTQLAGTELWVEAGASARYTDKWYAFPDQQLHPLAEFCMLWERDVKRRFEEGSIIKITEEKSRKYGRLMQRQAVGACSRPSTGPSQTSETVPSTTKSQTMDSRTSVPMTDTGIPFGPHLPSPSTQATPTSLSPSPQPSRALTINMDACQRDATSAVPPRWHFYATSYGKAVTCGDMELVPRNVSAPDDGLDRTNKRLQGSWRFKLWNEDCEYANPGNSLGILSCGSGSSAQQISCLDHPAWVKRGKQTNAYNCGSVLTVSRIICPY